jgi:hypothetical protein
LSAELPKQVRVKISSEAAAEIAMTPVVAQEMELRALIEVLVGVCGKDARRISELLSRGSVVESASRFRWTPFEAPEESLAGVLASFPDPNPTRPFDQALCIGARLHGPRARIELPRELASTRRFFKRRSFWDALMAAVEGGSPAYVNYSYRERADIYHLPAPAALADAAKLLTYSGLVKQVENATLTHIELLVRR